MRKLEKRTKGMRALAAAFALVVGLTSFNGISALAGRMKDDGIKKEYKTEDIEGPLLELGKKAVRVDKNTYDVTLSVKDKSFEHEKKMPLSNTDVVFVVDTSASMDGDNGWVQLKNVLGDKNKGLVYNILGNGNEESNNSVTFVGYGGGVFTYTPDYYISDKFTSNNIANAVAEYDSSKKMSSKIDGSKGGGNLIAGFEGAKQAIAKLKEDGRNQVVVLITDGDPSVGHRIYTLYSNSDNKPGEGWEEYKQSVSARYWKRMGNLTSGLYKKYIYSKDLDAYNTDKEDLSDYGKDYEYKDTKWNKEVRTNLNSRIDIKDPRQIKYTLEKAEELKKLTSNDKIYTVNVKNIKSSLLEKGLFKKHYYNATVKETGERLYNDIYDDLFKVGNYTYQATGIKLHDELSEFVEFDEKENLVINIGENKVVLYPGVETYDVIPFISKVNNYGLGDVEIRYNKREKSFNWTVANGIPEGTTINLTYRVKLSDKAVIPGKGREGDYKDGVEGLVKTAKNTGTHADKYAYPVSKEDLSYVNYGVKEVARDAKDGKDLAGEAIDNKFPVAGVRPDEIKYNLTVIHKYGDSKSEKTEALAEGSAYSEDKQEKDDWIFESATVNDQSYTGNLPITGSLEKNTEIVFIYKKRPVLPKKGKVVVRDIFKVENSSDINVDRFEEIIDIGEEKEYTPLSEADLDNKKGVLGYPADVEFYTAKSSVPKRIKAEKEAEPNYVEFEYILSKEVVKVYDHFNDEDGLHRENSDITIRKAAAINTIPYKLEDIQIKDGKGHWEIVKKGSGTDEKDYEIIKGVNEDREIHFYYRQKAKLYITNYFDGNQIGSVEEKDVLFNDSYSVNVKEEKDYSFDRAEIKRGENGNIASLNLSSGSLYTENFTIDNENIYVSLYYKYVPKSVQHTINHVFEGENSRNDFSSKSLNEGDSYKYEAREEEGWNLKAGTESVYEGTVEKGEGDKTFTFTYVKDLVNITINDNFVDENEQPVQGVDKAGNPYSKDRKYQGLRGSSYTPKALEVDEKVWDISTAESRILKADEESFTFIYKKKSKTIKISDKYGTGDSAVRSTSKAAIDATFEVEPLLKDNWTVDRVIVNGSEKSLVDGRLKVEGYNDEEIVFIYKDNSQPKPEIKPEPQEPSKPEIKPEPQEPSNPVVPTPEPQTPSDSTSPTSDTPVVDVTEDTTPQGTAPTTPTNPSEDNTDETGIVDINEDDTPQGEADIEDDKTPKGIAKTTEKVKVEEDATPQGNAALPKTGGTNADIFGFIGLGLIGLGLAVKKRK